MTLRRTALAFCLLPLPALAQQSDRDYLTAFLEDNLSGVGRQVVITGFAGALSSQARLTELTIADDAGVWLTLRDVVLDWNRAALFSGNVSINELTAAEIIVARPPLADISGPTPEAGTFTLPDLPVSVQINRIAAQKITLGPEVLGQAVEGRFEAALQLSGGQGSADLLLERQDNGPEGRIALKADYANDTQKLALNLSATEGAGGLIVTALDLPGSPAASFEISGNGPISDFIADIALATDGVDRLAGRVVTQSAGDETGFAANLKGDLAPLFLPEYAAFFGNSVALQAQGTAQPDGLDLSRLHIAAKALDLTGSLSLDADGQPRAFALTGQIAQPDGSAVLLPLTTDLPVSVQQADIDFSYDKAVSDGWTGRATLQGLDRADFQASNVVLQGSGRIGPDQTGATVLFDAEGLQPTDAAMAKALGSFVSGDAVIYKRSGEDLAIPRLTLAGQDYRVTVLGGRVKGLADSFALTGKVIADLADLSRFDQLAGLPLTGSTKAEVAGQFQPLTGAFDLTVKAAGTDMAMGQPQIDALMRGQATLTAELQRDRAGVVVKSAAIVGNRVSAQAQGVLSSSASDLTASLRFDDLSVIRGFGGQMSADARFRGPLDSANISATATAQGLRIGNPQVDKVIGGQSQLSADLSLQDGKLRINAARLTNPELSADLSGLADSTRQTLDIKASLRNLGVILPDFPGPLTLTGAVVNQGADATVDLEVKGPGGINAVITGKVAAGRGDLAIKGQGQAALANVFITPRAVSGDLGFDLRLNGPLQLSSLGGQVTLNGGRLSDPALAFGFDGITARADLSGGQAKVAATLPLTTKGKVVVAGTVGLSEPYPAALGLVLEGITVRDPSLYESRLRGELKLVGPLLNSPLLSGQIDLVETELRVPSTGFGGAAGLPDLRHVNEPADVRATRARAGLLESAARSARQSNSDLRLDVTISAPSRVFLRGRGLDAELGGEVRLLGSLSNLQPAGAFNLIRGRLEILGKRLDLEEALLQLEGDLVPFLRILASTQSDDITASVLIEGRADDPKVSFTSMPELPEEEVLAQLLFGQGLQNLSALQALQLANAVATLAGRGGEGVVSKLRQGFGLDNLDVKTTTEGGAEVTAGKYIGKNTYTEVTVGQNGKSQINLNLDLSDSITLRGKAGSDGNTGVGIFLEKDY